MEIECLNNNYCYDKNIWNGNLSGLHLCRGTSKGNDKYEVIDIGRHVRDLKAFLKLRDRHPAFNEAKSAGAVGIPCFVLEDGTVTLHPEDAGLHSRPINEGATCNIDGSGC